MTRGNTHKSAKKIEMAISAKKMETVVHNSSKSR